MEGAAWPCRNGAPGRRSAWALLDHAPPVGLGEAGLELGLGLQDSLDHRQRQVGVVLGDQRELRVVLQLTGQGSVVGGGASLQKSQELPLLRSEPDGYRRRGLLL